MLNIQIDKKKAEKKWSPIIESLGVNEGYKKSWMAEYAEYHQLNENAAYANASIAGMGAVVAPQPGTIPGAAYTGNGTTGSGDLGQQLIAASMKVAAHTIGLDLVAVKPASGPVVDLYYVDYRYDDTRNGADEKPQLFKVRLNTADQALMTAYLNAVISGTSTTQNSGGLNKRLFVPLTGAGATAAGTTTVALTEPTGTKEGNLEFLGYSRIDGFAMFRSWRQDNTASAGGWTFDATKNTFDVADTIQTVVAAGLAALTTPAVAATGALASASIELISAMEDQIPGYVTNWHKTYPMPREEDDSIYPGIIAPNVSTKRITVGTIEISSALRRTEMEDIKAQTGMDIVQKLEAVLVNELSQVISRQIVDKIFELGVLNRASAPVFGAGTIFDLDTSYVTAGPQGETTHAVQRKLVSKIMAASNFIASEGRIGPATFLVTNGRLAAALADSAAYTIAPVKGNMPMNNGQLYPVGQIANVQVYVDPYMKYDDNRIALGRRNAVDEPGIVFIPYLMAQSISLISEATRAPRLFLRSRYTIAEIGFFPQKSYMVINVTDAGNYLV